MRSVMLGDIAAWGSGGTPSRSVREYFGAGLPWLSIADLDDGPVGSAKESLTPLGLQNSSAKAVPAGTLLIAMYGSIGKLGIATRELCTSQAIAFAIPDNSRVNTRYLFHYLLAQRPKLQALGRGGTQSNIGQGDLKSWRMLLPPLPEQRRIAEIMDKADALRAKRRAAIAQLDTLTQSIFLDMFGDPATNPKGWPSRQLGECAIKFSDGPFGSNLKSSHYTEVGVRVVRLQNIGVGEFLDADAAYISEHHFSKLKKHECAPGDVLVGTLGDPNLRACIQPRWLSVALNKADCVQIRPDSRTATSEYLCALLNQPATERMAQNRMHGQTRVRISMGKLKGLSVPVPPIRMQRDFANREASLELQKAIQRKSLSTLNTLFSTLQQAAFAGRLAWNGNAVRHIAER